MGSSSASNPAIHLRSNNREIRNAISTTGDYLLFDYTGGTVNNIISSTVNNVNTFNGNASTSTNSDYLYKAYGSSYIHAYITAEKINSLDGHVLHIRDNTGNYGLDIGACWAVSGIWARRFYGSGGVTPWTKIAEV